MAVGSLIIKILANIDDVKEQTAKVDKVFSDLGNEINSAAMVGDQGLNKLGDNLINLGSTMDAVGNKLITKVTLPIAAAFGASAKAAIDFESDFAGVRKTVDASEDEFAILNKAIREMATTMPASAGEMAKVMEIAGQLGIHQKDLTKFTEVMINMGVATDLSSEQAATSFARFANIMQTSSDDYEKLGSAVVHLGNNYATTESEIVNMAMRLAGSGKQLNMTEGEVFGIATALSSVGIRAEAGGTSMSKMMDSMAIATSVGNKQMAELRKSTGMTTHELNMMAKNNSKGFKALADSMNMPVDQMKNIVKAGYDLEKMSGIAGMSVEDFSKIVEDDAAGALNSFLTGLFDTNRHGKDAIELIKEMNINEVRLTDTLRRAGGARDLLNNAIEDGNTAFDENTALATEANERYGTMASQLQITKNLITDIAITVGEALMPMMRDMNEWIQKLLNKIREMDPKKIEFIVKSLLKLATLGPTLKLVGGLFDKIGKATKAASAIQGIANSFKSMTDRFSVFEGALKKGSLDKYFEGGWGLDDLMANMGTGKNVNSKTGLPIGLSIDYAEHIKKFPVENLTKIDRAQQEINKTMAQGVIRSKNLTSTEWFKTGPSVATQTAIANSSTQTTVLGKAMQALVSPLGQVTAGLTLAAGYFTYSAKTSKEFSTGLKVLNDTTDATNIATGIMGGILETLQGVFGMLKAPVDALNKVLDASGVAMTDLALIVGGVLMIALFPVAGTFGAIATSVGLVSAAIKMLGTAALNGKGPHSVYTEELNKATLALGSYESAAQKLASEAMPALTASVKESMGVISDPKAFELAGGTLETIQESNTKISEEYTKFFDEYYATRKTSLDEFYALMDATNSENHAWELLQLRTKQQTEEEDLAATLARKEELEKLQLEKKGGLNQKEIEEYQGLIAKLEEITAEKFRKEEIQRELESSAIVEHYKKTGELTEENEAKLIENLKLNSEAQVNVVRDKFADELLELEKKYGKDYEKSEEFHKEKEALQDRHYKATRTANVKSYKEMTEDFLGFTRDEVKAAKKHFEDVEILRAWDDVKNKNHHKVKRDLTEENIKDIRKRTDAFEASVGMTADQYEEAERLLEKHGELSEEIWGENIVAQEEAYDLEFMSKKIAEQEPLVTIESVLIGRSVPEGLAKGIAEKSYLAKDEATRTAEETLRAARRALNTNSPSKKFIEMGGFVSEGFAIGIERDSNMATRSVTSMMDKIKSIGENTSLDLETQAVTNVVSNYQTRGRNQLVDTLAVTVAKELAKKPIRAYIDEDDFDEGVNDAVVKEMRRR